jgi:hypothetical protein
MSHREGAPATATKRPQRRRLTVGVPLALGLPWLLISCGAFGALRPLGGLNRQLEQMAGSSSEPVLAGPWLALIARRNGRSQVQLIDVNRGTPVPLPGLNRPDAQPLAVAVDGVGERLLVVRQLEGRTELILHRRSLQAQQPIGLAPAGVPKRLSLSGDGRLAAVEVGRDGFSQIDLISLP